jgi:hypothetical protein
MGIPSEMFALQAIQGRARVPQPVKQELSIKQWSIMHFADIMLSK